MILRASTVFGADPDYWTLALLATDQPAMPGEFEILFAIEAPDGILLRHAAE